MGIGDLVGRVTGRGGPALDVAGATVVVTGAAGGMGEHIAKGFARRGADLAVVDRDEEGLARVVGEIEAETQVRVTSYVVDLADREAVTDLAARLRDGHPPVRVLVNNAGVALGGRFTEITEDEFDWLLEVNLHTPIRLTRALLPIMLENGEGQVVNLSSLFGILGVPGQTAYSTSKFGLRGFNEALRNELSAEDCSVGVTSVHPGGIATNIAKNARTGSGVDPAEAEQGKRKFDKVLRYPAAKAGEEIVQAALARRSRLLIGMDARALDALVRATPSSYWSYLGPVMDRAGR
ncbi:SDR family oxidoreductase [Marihabitans asiaticum]|uniref:Short-subunit dehydrogenase n=1 Tax=Marihabitans asiaticum TaxID=415218 RepID=A0A560WEB5_9MICO|nr:SDR family NAD(P)-dependent oxidoreductase [Marihabitans asiaticum]TWD16013.1 short-subunit dehydrogenase [Marihabitans asiaticum]